MAYQALYRKYRPKTFDEVIGQQVVKKTLTNAISTNKISHAYLLSGPRGTGKTTIAKIMARAINCLNPSNGNPCGHCDNCISSIQKECPDIIEIDAASNNGVDEIRELKDKINHVPSQLNYKVYIIDEVHMLTTGAFNALLKTLEEPPTHAIFILATTDVHKIPITILSRCQTFTFKRINEIEMVDHLKDICEKENINIDDEVLDKISLYSDGCLRDALGLLDKLSSYETCKITMDSLIEINGSVSNEDMLMFIELIYEKNIEKIVEQINQFYTNGKDMIILAEDIINILEKKLIDQYINKAEKEIDSKLLINVVYTVSDLIFKMKSSNNPKLILELGILKLVSESNKEEIHHSKETNIEIDQSSSIDKIQNVEKNNMQLTTKNIDNESQQEKNISREIICNKKSDEKIAKIRINNTFATASKILKKELESQWHKIEDLTFDQKYGAIACLLMDSEIQAVGTNNIIFTYKVQSYVEKTNQNSDLITEMLNYLFKQEYKIIALSESEWEQTKKEFISKLNAKIKYTVITEPDDLTKSIEIEASKPAIIPDEETDDISNIVQMFGNDIVKID